MSNFQLKLIALITMTLDHIGFLLVAPWSPYYEPLRIVGRLSFVLFAFLITEGLGHTKNKERYIANLIIFGFVIDIPRLFGGFEYFANVFYTLGFGALAIYLFKKFDNLILQVTSILAMMYLAEAIGSDYGAYGVLIIVSIEVARMMCNNIPIVTEAVMALFYWLISTSFAEPEIQFMGVYAFLIIALYNGKRGYYHPKLKYLIYVYYPVHLLILTAIGLYVM